MAGRPGRENPCAGVQGRVPPVADRVAREIQSELADLRWAEAHLVSLSGADWASRTRRIASGVASGAGRYRIEPSGPADRSAAGAVGGSGPLGLGYPRR